MQDFLYLCSVFMKKRDILHIIEWVITLSACVYLVWRLATYDDYSSLISALREMDLTHICAIILCVGLMPVNMSLEAWRWRTLMNDGMSREQSSLNEPLTLNDATRQVYYSKLAGVITPWRLGEYPARGVLMSTEPRAESQESLWGKVLSMGAVGSATMTMAIIIAGIIGIAWSPSVVAYLGDSYLYSLLAAIIILAILFAFAPRLLKRWAKVNHDLMLRSIAQSLVRLACWCVQLFLVLYALGAIYHLPCTIYHLPIYYLLVTVTPNVPIAEVGVRGAWAMVVFGNANAVLAGVILWAVNTLLPCLGWFFIRKNNKKFA